MCMGRGKPAPTAYPFPSVRLFAYKQLWHIDFMARTWQSIRYIEYNAYYISNVASALHSNVRLPEQNHERIVGEMRYGHIYLVR